MVGDLLAERGIIVSHQTVRAWAGKFGREFTKTIRRLSAGKLGDKSPRHLQRVVFIHDPLANLFHLPRHEMTSAEFRELRSAALDAWRDIANLRAAPG